jgi:hypothetical protein
MEPSESLFSLSSIVQHGVGAGGALALLAAGAAVGVAIARVLRRGRRDGLEELAATALLDPEDLRFVRRIAARAGVAPIDVVSRLELFESATALALADASPDDAAPVERVARLRAALGFNRLPVDALLLTTREILVGTAVELDHGGRRKGVVVAVDEKSCHVEVEGFVQLGPGDEVGLTIKRGHGLYHRAQCLVLDRNVTSAGKVRLSLAHDEAPVQLQRREYVRVPVEGSISVRPLQWTATSREAGSTFTARLVDVGGGGVRVTTSVSLPVGLVAEVGFAVGSADFTGLRAQVLACTPSGSGEHSARLQLKGIPERERERLTTAVWHAEARARDRGQPV